MPYCGTQFTNFLQAATLSCIISMGLSVSRNKEGKDVSELRRVIQYIAKGSCLESVRFTTRRLSTNPNHVSF